MPKTAEQQADEDAISVEDAELVTGTLVGTDIVPLPQVREALISGRIPDVIDEDAVSREIAMMMLDAKGAEQVFSVPGTVKPASIFGVPFTLRRIRFMPSSIEDARIPVYAILDMVDAAGEVHVVPCGGQSLMIQCLNAREQNLLPQLVRLIEVGVQKVGRNRPIYLELVTD